MSLNIALEKGLIELKLVCSSQQVQQLLSFIARLEKWNRHFNLTAVRSPFEMVSRHILDSLSVAPYLHGKRIIDVGTGAGIPGIPLSILCQEKVFYLLDNNHKKQVFVTQAVKSLALKNAFCVHAMVQTYQPEQKFSTILTRAFAPLEQMITLSAHLLAEDGRILAMMGKVQPELPPLPSGYQFERIVSLNVPGQNAQRHLAIIKRHSH